LDRKDEANLTRPLKEFEVLTVNRQSKKRLLLPLILATQYQDPEWSFIRPYAYQPQAVLNINYLTQIKGENIIFSQFLRPVSNCILRRIGIWKVSTGEI